MKIIALCVMMLFTVTLISFSQTSQNGQEYGEMNTPRQERWFDITNLEGRTITAVVVGFNEEAIAIRVSNNASIAYIPWENLDEATIATLFKGSIRPRATASTIVKTAAVMPYQTTITDKQGRSIKGDILGKSNTAITFQREGETTNFEVQIATLSDDNQEMIAGLIATAPTTNKPTVLIHHDFDYNGIVERLTGETLVDRVTLLQNNGFHVTIGFSYQGGELSEEATNKRKRSNKIPKEIDAITIAPLSVLDKYDFFWGGSVHANENLPEFNRDAIVAYRHAQNGKTIQAALLGYSKKNQWVNGRFEGRSARVREEKNHVTQDGSWIFYATHLDQDPQSQTKVFTELIQTMKKMLE